MRLGIRVLAVSVGLAGSGRLPARAATSYGPIKDQTRELRYRSLYKRGVLRLVEPDLPSYARQLEVSGRSPRIYQMPELARGSLVTLRYGTAPFEVDFFAKVLEVEAERAKVTALEDTPAGPRRTTRWVPLEGL